MVAAFVFVSVMLFLIAYFGGAVSGALLTLNWKENVPLVFFLFVLTVGLVVLLSGNVLEPLVREILK